MSTKTLRSLWDENSHRLSEREFRNARDYLFNGWSMQDLVDRDGLSREVVRQVLMKARRKLRLYEIEDQYEFFAVRFNPAVYTNGFKGLTDVYRPGGSDDQTKQEAS